MQCLVHSQFYLPLLWPFVVRYYKKFTIPDLNRLNLPLEQKQIKVAHANNTLIVTVSLFDYNSNNSCRHITDTSRHGGTQVRWTSGKTYLI